jgi:hypothetical protein
MSNKRDETAAAKAKKQKVILIVGGVALLGLGVLQGPKLLDRGTPAETVVAEPADAASEGQTDGAPEAVVAAGTTPAGGNVVVAAANTGAVVAGVALPRKSTVRPATSQLASFTLFEFKDPFVPQDGGNDADAETSPAQDAPPPSSDTPAGSGEGTSSTTGSGEQASQGKPLPIVYATIDLDGKPQQVTVKDKFPAKEPLFVLRSLNAKQAKIGVAGGSFDDGTAVTLRKGKSITLVNTATGVRYVLKLVYTGASPEVLEEFTTAGATTPTTTTSATP